jgi:4-hydroxy-tetrahydrodipicolinate synthase
LAEVFYAPPFVDMHNRMKEALVLLGRLERAIVRPPLCRIADAERARIAVALQRAGLAEPSAALAAPAAAG